MAALYLSLSITTAVREANQGFAFKIDPCVLCSYEVDCEDIADLRSEEGRAERDVPLSDMACAWFSHIAAGADPPSWAIARRLIAAGYAGILVPSFAPGATDDESNLVLWLWGADAPHAVSVHDPDGKLPRNRVSWR